jgi:putative Ca2+/H+ antiporter (TMEM165/GDT1 family)
MRWVVGLGFIGMVSWILIPDKADDGAVRQSSYFDVYGTTVIALFFAEMGDKTRIATAALAAHYDSLLAVVTGATLGVSLADVPAVFLGDAVARRSPLRTCAASQSRALPGTRWPYLQMGST